MSADELRKAAEKLRNRAEAATPGKWIDFGNAIGVTVKGCTCAGPIPGYPQHEQFCGTDGPVAQADPTDVAYIAMVQPSVGLALADWLEDVAADAQSNDEHDGLDPYCTITGYGYALAIARSINGGAS